MTDYSRFIAMNPYGVLAPEARAAFDKLYAPKDATFLAGGSVTQAQLETEQDRTTALEDLTESGRLSEAQQNATFIGRRVLLAFGNSITNWWASGTRFTTELASRIGSLGDSLTLIEEGTGGADTDDMVAALPALLATYSPTWVTLPISINDRKTGALTPSESMANIEKMVGMCRWNGAGVILMTEPPLNPPVATVTDPNFTLTSESNRRIANDLLRTYAADNGLVLADVDAAFASNDTSASTDGIHPTGTLSGGESGLDAICATVVDAVLTASPEVFGWPLVLNGSGGDDDFERADNASTLGGSWTADDGTWGILDGRAYSVSAATWDRASADTSSTDHTIHVVGAGSPGVAYEPCVMTRFTNAASGYYLAVLSITAGRVGTAKLYRVNGMSPTQIGPSVVVPGTLGDTVELELASVGTLHTLRVNGMTTHRATDATYTTGTRVGLARLSTQLGFDEASWRI